MEEGGDSVTKQELQLLQEALDRRVEKILEETSEEFREFRQDLDKRLNGIDERLSGIDTKIDNLAAQQEQVSIDIGALDTRLSSVERVVNQLAARSAIQSVPALGGSRAGLPIAAKPTEND